MVIVHITIDYKMLQLTTSWQPLNKDFCSKQFLEIRKMVQKFEEICHKVIFLIYQEENRDQMIKMPVEIFPNCPYPADVHYVDLPEVYKARVLLIVWKTYFR